MRLKILHFSIIAILLVVVFSSSLAYAEQPLLDFYNNSQLVLVGKVISLSQVPTTTSNPSQSPNQTRYDIQVEQYYKNPQAAKLITAYGYAKGIYFGQDPTFNVGDRVFLYLNQENVYYQIQSHSFALNNDCDARPMIPMPTLPFEPPPISAPAYGRVFDFQSAGGIHNDTFGLGDKIRINFVAENYLPVIKYATLNFTIKTENNTNLVFNDTKQITIPACNGNVPVSWDFVPKSSGTYFVNINTSSSVNLGRQPVLFTEPSLGSSFEVRENTSGISLAKTPYTHSPLKQFKSGILANDVKCIDGYTLIIKTEDGSPACVKPETAQKLVARGWGVITGSTVQLGVINQTSQMTEFDGVIVDQRLDVMHSYSFYTNDTSEKFNIGSNGIGLEGLDNIDGLDGKYIKIFGTLVQTLYHEDEIKVDKFKITGSLVPKANPTKNMSQQITLDELYSNPDKYYNQTVTIMGQLREYDNPIAYAGVGCSSAQFTTNESFVPDFISRNQLYNGQNYIGVRIGGPDDVGYSPTERLPADLKNKSVFVTGIFVPEIYDTGMCMHVLHESGYLLTNFDKIQPIGG